MDPSFEPYFTARVQQMRRENLTGELRPGGFEPRSGLRQWPPGFEARVFDAVAGGYEGMGPGLVRSDAELLLQLAFWELLAQPLIAVRGPEVKVDDLLGAIARDSRTITQNALAAREQPEPVSAHGIVDATSRSWAELSTAGFEVWD
jgi:hypothetical protein